MSNSSDGQEHQFTGQALIWEGTDQEEEVRYTVTP